MRITQITAENADLLNNVDAEIFDEPVHAQRLAAYVQESSHIMLVAIIDSKVIGQVLGVIHKHPDKPTELYIDDLAVANELKRNGIATMLVNTLIEHGKQNGCEEIWVATEPENEEANLFYRSLKLQGRSVRVFEGCV